MFGTHSVGTTDEHVFSRGVHAGGHEMSRFWCPGARRSSLGRSEGHAQGKRIGRQIGRWINGLTNTELSLIDPARPVPRQLQRVSQRVFDVALGHQARVPIVCVKACDARCWSEWLHPLDLLWLVCMPTWHRPHIREHSATSVCSLFRSTRLQPLPQKVPAFSGPRISDLA